MRVKLKVKHLVMMLITLFSFLLFFIYIIQPYIDVWTIQKQIDAGKNEQAKAAIIDRIENNHPKKLLLIKKYMIDLHSDLIRYDLYISSVGSSTVRQDQLFTLEEIEPYLHMYVEETKGEVTKQKAYVLLSNFYEMNGQYEVAATVLEEALSNITKNGPYYHDLRFKQIGVSITVDPYEKTAELISDLIMDLNENTYMAYFFEITTIAAENKIREGKYKEASLYIEEQIDKYILSRKEDEFFDESHLMESSDYQELVRLNGHLQKASNENSLSSVTGQVKRLNGEPLANVGVMLYEGEGFSVIPRSNILYTVTDENGSFEISHVFPGRYSVVLGTTLDQIDGWEWRTEPSELLHIKIGESVEFPIVLTPLIETIAPSNYKVNTQDEIRFVWVPHPGAASYELWLYQIFDESSTGVRILSDITDEQVTIFVGDLYSFYFPYSYNYENEDQKINPGSVLGFANAEGTFSWAVHAFNEEGKLIGQSDGYRLSEETMKNLPFFHLRHRELSETDRRFLDNGNIEEALVLYKKDLENDPNDSHSKRMIEKLKKLADNE